MAQKRSTPRKTGGYGMDARGNFGVYDEIAGQHDELTVSDVLHPAMDALSFKSLRLYTGILAFDLMCGLPFGKTIQLIGEQHVGKSLFTMCFMAAAQKTCRVCFTPIIDWIADYAVLQKDPKEWERLTKQWHDTRECPFPSVRTCKCGANDPCRIVLIDAEESFDPYWASIWGVDIGDPSAYDDVDYEQGKSKGHIWTGIRATKDERFVVMRPVSLEQAQDLVLPTLDKGVADLLIFDSIAAVAVDEELQRIEKGRKKDEALAPRVGSRARALNALLPVIASKRIVGTRKTGSKTTTVLVNQFRAGPVANPRMDPNRPVGGKGLQYYVDQTLHITHAKSNADIPDGWKKPAVTRDVFFKMDKSKAAGGGSSGGSGDVRFFFDDYRLNDKVTCRAGTTDDAARVLELLRTMPEVFRAEKGKAYWVFGRPFRRVADIAAFLNRRDVGYLARFVIFASRLAVSARLHLRAHDYDYSPYRDDPLIKAVESYVPKTGEALRAVRATREDVAATDDDPAAAE